MEHHHESHITYPHALPGPVRLRQCQHSQYNRQRRQCGWQNVCWCKPFVSSAWEGKAAHRIHRVHRFFDFNMAASGNNNIWTEVGASLTAGYSVMLTLEPTFGDNYTSMLPQIINGSLDPYIDAHIAGIKTLQAAWPAADIWMRFGHEMNGDWYPWGGLNGHNANTAQNYIDAFQHVVTRFRNAGLPAAMVKWVWSPNVWTTDNFSAYYPGDPYTDMISVSGFNFGPNTTLHPALVWESFNTIHKFTYDTLTTLHPNLPYFIGGVSSAESGGSKGAWIDDMTVQLLNGYPNMAGIFWFNVDKSGAGEANWTIDSSPASLAAVQRMYTTAKLWQR